MKKKQPNGSFFYDIMSIYRILKKNAEDERMD